MTLEHSVPQIGAPAAWQAGYTGAGTTVAVVRRQPAGGAVSLRATTTDLAGNKVEQTIKRAYLVS